MPPWDAQLAGFRIATPDEWVVVCDCCAARRAANNLHREALAAALRALPDEERRGAGVADPVGDLETRYGSVDVKEQKSIRDFVSGFVVGHCNKANRHREASRTNEGGKEADFSEKPMRLRYVGDDAA